MKTLMLFTIVCTLMGCATNPRLVSAVYKPERSGVIKVPMRYNPSFVKQDRLAMTKMMNGFCRTQRPEIMSIDQVPTITGSAATNVGAVQWSEATTEDDNFVHFRCVDGPQEQNSFEKELSSTP